MKKIAMVVLSSFPRDVRVRREAEALEEAGNQVDVICITPRGEPKKEVINNINIYRLGLKRQRAGKLAYIWEYIYFFMWAFFKLTLLFASKKYDLIHVHNMPDILVFTAIIPKLFGKRVILDMHDPMPELYMTMFEMNNDAPLIKFLRWTEKISIKFVDQVITPNISFRNLFISRGCPPEKINIVMNSPDEKIFKKNGINGRRNTESNFVIMYHGTILKRSGLDILIDAVALVRDKIPNLKVIIYGRGNFLDEVKRKVTELNLSKIVEIRGSVIVDEIAEAIKGINLGIIPNRLSPFTQINFPVRTFEYLVMNKPVIVPMTKGILDYFSEGSIFFFKAGDCEDLAKTIFEVYRNKENTKLILTKSIEVFSNYSWEYQKQNLIELTNKLTVNK